MDLLLLPLSMIEEVMFIAKTTLMHKLSPKPPIFAILLQSLR